jgi:hypothetical protein
VLPKLSAITWTIRPHIFYMHLFSLMSRGKCLELGRPAPGDTKETLIRLLRRAATELPWPELPAKTKDMFDTSFGALDVIARLGEPEVAVDILSRHVEDIERKVVALNYVAKYLIYRLHWLFLSAVKFEEDQGKRNAYVAEAKGLMGRATRSLRGLQPQDFDYNVRDHGVTLGTAWLTSLFEMWQVSNKCRTLLRCGTDLHLLPEIIAFARELVKVAPAGLHYDCYLNAARAMLCLQKLDEAEDILHKGLAASGQEHLEISHVSPLTRRSPHTHSRLCVVGQSFDTPPAHLALPASTPLGAHRHRTRRAGCGAGLLTQRGAQRQGGMRHEPCGSP